MKQSRNSRLAGFVLAALGLAAAGAAHAQLTVGVARAWVRATVPQQKSTGGYVQLTASGDARLVEAVSPAAGRIDIHTMEMGAGHVMKMRHADGIDLPAGKAVDLKPGGMHLMLMDLKAPLKPGQKVPVVLYIEGKDKARVNVTVNMAVKELTATQ